MRLYDDEGREVSERPAAAGEPNEKDERTLLLEHVVNRARSCIYAAPELRALHEERLAEALNELHAYDVGRGPSDAPPREPLTLTVQPTGSGRVEVTCPTCRTVTAVVIRADAPPAGEADALSDGVA